MRIDLQTITTRDGVMLDGGVVRPKREGKRALIFIPGLSGTFFDGRQRIEKLATACAKSGILFSCFNTRGSDIVSSIDTTRRRKSQRGGAAFERFEDCIHDIRAMVDHCVRDGYRSITLLGHSTGANKVVYYCSRTNDRRVKKLILLGPLSDVVGEMQERGRSFKKFLKAAQAQMKRGKGDELFLDVYPERLWSARRYLSLYTPGSREDVSPYYNPKGNWRSIERIRIPTLVVIGDRDQYLDRDAHDVMQAFEQHVRTFRGIIIEGADHSFNKREKELARVVMRFVDA